LWWWCCCRLVSQGKSNTEIAEKLDISRDTVSQHINRTKTHLTLMLQAHQIREAVEQTVDQAQEATEQEARQALRAAEEATEQVLRQTERATRQAELQAAVLGALKTANYEELNVDEISERLDDLSTDQLKQVREYEKQNKNRETLIEQIDRTIRVKQNS
jgi:predicted transcriptional regulator